MSLWLISSMVNFVLQHYIVSAKNPWFSTIAKDMVITASILSIITVARIGVFNSCWCNSSAMSLRSNAYVVFGPFSDEDWNNGVLLWSPCHPLPLLLPWVSFYSTVTMATTGATCYLAATASVKFIS